MKREKKRAKEGRREQEREREKLAYPEFFVPFSDQSLWVFVSFSLLIFDKLSRNQEEADKRRREKDVSAYSML